tara:strand:+ start:6531 stop:7568 length:1038 start_codon:yes stop_codon:yes gene_type:complete
MGKLKLSIVTATYNCESLLKNCLESVAAQSAIENVEHIIVDGGSTDSTVSIASSFPHVEKMLSKPDRGVYHAYNRGVELASGDIIYFLGADDTLYDNSTVSSILSSFEDNDIEFVAARVHCFNEETGEKWIAQLDAQKGGNVCHQGFFCRKSLFEKIGPFNECLKLCADTLFMRTVFNKCKGKNLDLIAANFRQGGVSSVDSNRLILRKELQVIRILLGEETTSIEHHLDRNVTDLKFLLEKSLVHDAVISRYTNKRIAIFGTRQLSLSIAKLLLNIGAHIECFVVSDDIGQSCIMNIPIIPLSLIENIESCFLINCIEGKHEREVAENINHYNQELKVISWRDL